MLSKLLTLTKDPLLGVYVLRSKVAPAQLIDRLSRLTQGAGITSPRFLLSFDCDTDLDIEVVEGVHERLGRLGITPVYAVPGQLLERGRQVYARIAATGAEFLNHGWAEHTRLDRATMTYDSFLFYDRQSNDWITDDIRRGHASVAEVTGRAPMGFRTPHFGSYQTADQLAFLHGTLAGLGYRFSTSTVPFWGLRYGPVVRQFALSEIPVSGTFEKPLDILDTWTHRFLGEHGGEAGYARQYARYRDFLKTGKPLLINVYGDPSQVYDWPGFFDAVAQLAPWSVSSYAEALTGAAR
jgi:peptidoglycan/xylan/chitin deacetylase (PgdA/CDA1 family)